MNKNPQDHISKRRIWGGRLLTGLVTAAMGGSAIAKIAGVPAVVEGLTHAGFPQGAIIPIAILELTCLALYLFPRTKLIGTLLVTGFFGGAVVTHIVGRESLFPPLMIGFWAWMGAYLRMPELSTLLSLRRTAARIGFAGSVPGTSPELNRAR
jgi:DoxX-like protein